MTTDLDFTSDDVVENPLLPDNTYDGAISKCEVNLAKSYLRFSVTLNGNEGLYMTDGDTPADGAVVDYTIWLPKIGDEKEPTASGRGNKKDSKIRSFFTSMKLLQLTDQVSSPSDLIEMMQGGELTGLDVSVSTKVSEWNNNVFNQVSTLQAM